MVLIVDLYCTIELCKLLIKWPILCINRVNDFFTLFFVHLIFYFDFLPTISI